MSEEKTKPTYVTKSTVQQRDAAWTDASIRRLLDPPDRTRPNPHSQSQHPMKLYDLKRVEQVEQSQAFFDWKQASQRRRASARQAAVHKRDRALEWVEALKIKIPKMPNRKLVKRACDSYNEMSIFQDTPRTAHPDDDIRFLRRITLNYIRHELTDYEEHLVDLFGVVGKADAYNRLKERIYKCAIARYPWLNGPLDLND